jgi:hypothetical protein
VRCRGHGHAEARLKTFPAGTGIDEYSAAAMAPDRSMLVPCAIRHVGEDVFDKAESNVS